MNIYKFVQIKTFNKLKNYFFFIFQYFFLLNVKIEAKIFIVIHKWSKKKKKILLCTDGEKSMIDNAKKE